MKMFSVAALTTLLFLTSLAPAQVRLARGNVVTPDSSLEKLSDFGLRAHTNLHVFVPTTSLQKAQPFGAPYAGYAYETPASLGCVYNLVNVISAPCAPGTSTTNPSGGSKVIAIVDAYDA